MTLTETTIQMPVLNPTGKGRSHSFIFAGVVDAVDGGKLIDYKTVSDPMRFIDQHTIGFQAELYCLALAEHGVHVQEIEYRLVRRPTIQFCGKDKDVEAYEDRCVEWMNDQQNGLVEHHVYLNEHRLNQARHYLWECGKRILENRRAERWLPSASACYAYERPCEFLPLCRAVVNGNDWLSIASEQYRISEPHPELDGADAGEKSILTHSSLEKMARCEVLYYWKYERGLQSARETKPESLGIGQAFHRGMAAWRDEGYEFARNTVWELTHEVPALGKQAKKQDQDAAKVMSMLKVAWQKWP